MQTKELNALKDISCFVIECYIQAWISAPNIITAPVNDVIFFKKILNYNNNKLGCRMAIKILQGYEQNINEEQEENEELTKKLNLKYEKR